MACGILFSSGFDHMIALDNVSVILTVIAFKDEILRQKEIISATKKCFH